MPHHIRSSIWLLVAVSLTALAAMLAQGGPAVASPYYTAIPTDGVQLADPAPAGAAPEAAPNLLPYTPSGWSGAIVPSSVPGTHTTDTLYVGQPTYLDWAVANLGNATASGTFYICLYMDGVEIARWYTSDLEANYYTFVEDWSFTVNTPGEHVLRLRADCTRVVPEWREWDNGVRLTFTWQEESGQSGVVISDQQGFDKCAAATTSEMQTWWNSSPYWEANIYIGGANRACSQPNLTASWVSTVWGQGWNLIPTWVGLQAPCTTYGSRLSWDPLVAYVEGRSEADAALSVASNLGLYGDGLDNTIIYFDMEAYNTADTACREAVNAFISGWAGRLQELGHRAGAYGSGCGTAISDWASVTNVIDDVWAAHWIYASYNANATVWGVACVSDSLWNNHQRIRQYAGGHDETWGGLTFNIDSNALDGHVAGVNPHLLQRQTEIQRSPAATRMQLVASETGWMIWNQQVQWSDDGGQSWRNITPAGVAQVEDVFFLDQQQGWVIGAPAGSDTLALWRTLDGGATWTLWPLALELPAGQGLSGAYLHFVDGQTGWIAGRLASSANFSLGALWATTDGGQSWQARTLPVGAPVTFADAQTGWTIGGPARPQLYATYDGGHSWQAVEEGTQPITLVGGRGRPEVLLQVQPGTVPADMTLVTWASSDEAWGHQVTGSCQGNKTAGEPVRCVSEATLWRTLDGGSTWAAMTPPTR